MMVEQSNQMSSVKIPWTTCGNGRSICDRQAADRQSEYSVSGLIGQK